MQARANMNLTRDEAQSRARVLSVDTYDVELDLTREEPTFPSTTVVRFRCTEPGASTFIDLVAASVREVELNGRALDPARGLRRHADRAEPTWRRRTPCASSPTAAT